MERIVRSLIGLYHPLRDLSLRSSPGFPLIAHSQYFPCSLNANDMEKGMYLEEIFPSGYHRNDRQKGKA